MVDSWNENVFILTTSSWLAAVEVVKMIISGAASDDNFVQMATFPFQCMRGDDPLVVSHPQIAKTFGSTSIKLRSDAEVSDRCVIDVDPRAFGL